MYTNEVDLTEQSGKNILELLFTSDELLLDELIKHIQDHLIEKKSTWVEQNFILVLRTVIKLSSCKKLQDYPSVKIHNHSLLQKSFYHLIKIFFMDCLNEMIYRLKKLFFGFI